MGSGCLIERTIIITVNVGCDAFPIMQSEMFPFTESLGDAV